MDYFAFWSAVTIIGAPEYWLASLPILFVIYFLLRHALREDSRWKKAEPAFRRFLIIFIPSILVFIVLAFLLKTFLYLPRPCVPCPADGCNPLCPADSSFPSGHAGTIFIVFLSLYMSVRKRHLLWLLIIPVLVAASRLALGVHTLSDVAGGAFLGLVIPFLVSIILQKKHKLK